MNEKQKKLASLILMISSAFAPSFANAEASSDTESKQIQSQLDNINVFSSGLLEKTTPEQLFNIMNNKEKDFQKEEEVFLSFNLEERKRFYAQLYKNSGKSGELNFFTEDILGIMTADFIVISMENKNNVAVQLDVINMLNFYIKKRQDLLPYLNEISSEDFSRFKSLNYNDAILKTSSIIKKEIRNPIGSDAEKKEIMTGMLNTWMRLDTNYQELQLNKNKFQTIDTGQELFDYFLNEEKNIPQYNELFFKLSPEERMGFYDLKKGEVEAKDAMTLGMLGLLCSDLLKESVKTKDDDIYRKTFEVLSRYKSNHPELLLLKSENHSGSEQKEEVLINLANSIELELFVSENSKDYIHIIQEIAKNTDVALDVIESLIYGQTADFIKQNLDNPKTKKQSEELYKRSIRIMDTSFERI